MSRYAALELRFWASLAKEPKVFCSDSSDLLNCFRLRGSLLAELLRAVDLRAVDLRAVDLRRVVAFFRAGIESLSSQRTDGCLAPAMRFARRVPPRFLLRGRGGAPRAPFRPLPQAVDDPRQPLAVGGQPVLDLRRARWNDHALEDSGGLQLGQSLGERPGRHRA